MKRTYASLCAGLGALALSVGLVAVPALTAQSAQVGDTGQAADAQALVDQRAPRYYGDNPETMIGVRPGVGTPAPQARIGSRSLVRSGTPENVPLGQRSEAPVEPAAKGITFFENPQTRVAQQTPVYSPDVKPVVSPAGEVTGVTINGIAQNYETWIPYWCDVSNDGGNSMSLCYRETNMFQDQAQGAAVGERLSIIDGKPHIILDDENVDAGIARFLGVGALQSSMKDWNTLLGQDFFLLKSQTTTNASNPSGKAVINPARDYIQYLFIKTDNSPDFAAAAGTTGLRINMNEYNEGYSSLADRAPLDYSDWGYYFSREETRAGTFKRRNVVTWDAESCSMGNYVGSCVHAPNRAAAEQQWHSIHAEDWRKLLVHELGHMLGLDHPTDPTGTTFTLNNPGGGCAPGQHYYNNGPLIMQYQRDNGDSMLDGTMSSSVEYRMVKDLIAAGTNYIKQAMQDGQQIRPVTHRKIRVSVVDEHGAPSRVAAPIADQTQTVDYYGVYSDVKGASFCGGFDTTDMDKWQPWGQAPAVNVPELQGYEVSVDGGRTWARTATIPAVNMPSTAALQWNYSLTGRRWTSDGSNAVTNFGLADLADVRVIYRVRTLAPSPGDGCSGSSPVAPSPGGGGSGSSPVAPSPGGGGPASGASNSAVSQQRQVYAGSADSHELAATGSDVVIVAAAGGVFLLLGGAMLSIKRRMR